MEDSELNPCTYGYLIFDKEGKIIQWKKKPSSTNGAGITGYRKCRRMQIDPSLSLHKTQVQAYQKINIKPHTLNPKEEKMGNAIEFIGTEDNFLNRIPGAQTLRSTIDKWYL